MFIALLFVSAFMFFLAGRRVRHSAFAGIAVTMLASIPFSWRTLFGGYKILTYAGQFIPDIVNYDRNVLCLIFAAIVSLVFAAVFIVLAKMWSRDLFRIPGDEIKSRKMARSLFITASVIPGIVAVWLSIYKAVLYGSDRIRRMPYYLILFDNIGIEFLFLKREPYGPKRAIRELMRTANTVYVVLLLVLCVLCIILISRKTLTFKEFPSSALGTVSALPAAAISISLSGIILFLTIAQTGYVYWYSNFGFMKTIVPIYNSIIFGPYSKETGKFSDPGRYAFCMFVLGLMATGILILLISMIYMAIRKKIRQNLFSFIFSIVLMIISSGCILRMLTEIERFHRIGSW